MMGYENEILTFMGILHIAFSIHLPLYTDHIKA